MKLKPAKNIRRKIQDVETDRILCDNCQKESRTETTWFAYQGGLVLALCDSCYNEVGKPKVMEDWLDEVIG